MRFFALLLLSVCAHAAVVEGVVLDDETGNPLARTQVALIPLPGTPAEITPVRSGARGSFVILSVRPGWYVLRATRRGYAPAESGQSRPGRPGHAFEVADDRPLGFFEIHMTHLAAITGTVLDENGIGIPRWTVHIYSAQKPMRHIGQIETDDRGDYRIGELDPGGYYLRSGPGHFEDEAPVLATWSKAAVELKDAWPMNVRVGQTQQDVTIRPVKGKLLTLSGMLLPLEPGGATLTLVTDTGRRDVIFSDKARPFSAADVQPGPVELIVKGDDGFGNDCGSYQQVVIDADMSGLRLACNPIRKGSIQVSGAIPKSPIIVRRVADLDGAQESHPLARDEVLRPGHWELAVPPGDYYVVSVRSYGSPAAQAGPWYGFDVGSQMSVSVMLSSKTATITGVVSTKGNPVAGAPVYLVQTKSGQTWTVRSDPQGNYSIGGLGPGAYSILSSFELDQIDGASQLADAVSTKEGNTTVQALELILPVKYVLAAFLLSSCLSAATVQGVIFDEETQDPIARAHVVLVPLPGTSGGPVSLLANDNGRYVFSGVPTGWYVIRASRIGFETTEYGQAHPGLPGTPIEVTDPDPGGEQDLHQIVMRRQAAITGSVVDENLIGIPGWSISVYTARQPIRRIAEGMTDDRGNFRVGELEPGAYIVRSGGGGLDGVTTLVPSYYKYGTALDGAETVRVRLGETQGFVVIHTVEGRLFELSGQLSAPDKRPVRLTLITDTGRRVIATAAGRFLAADVPPGTVGLLAESAGCATYQTMPVDRNMFARVDCVPNAPPVVSGVLNYKLIARRVDLDGPGPEIALSAGQPLSPGHWEFTVRAAPAHYLVSVQNEGDATPPVPIDGWFGLDIGNAPVLKVALSAKPASISGLVSLSSKPVIGAPVFLQLVNPDAPDTPLQLWTGRADPQGNFYFNGLAPGAYRLMSSFDLEYDDPLARDKWTSVNVREGDTVMQSLEMIRQ